MLNHPETHLFLHFPPDIQGTYLLAREESSGIKCGEMKSVRVLDASTNPNNLDPGGRLKVRQRRSAYMFLIFTRMLLYYC